MLDNLGPRAYGPWMKSYRIVFRRHGETQTFGGDVLYVEAANERGARRKAREWFASAIIGTPPKIAWIDEIPLDNPDNPA